MNSSCLRFRIFTWYCLLVDHLHFGLNRFSFVTHFKVMYFGGILNVFTWYFQFFGNKLVVLNLSQQQLTAN